MIYSGDRVLPRQFLLRNQRAEIAHERAHVAVGKLVPGSGERIGELVRILVEAPGNFFVDRIEAKRQIRSQHGWRMALSLVVRIRH